MQPMTAAEMPAAGPTLDEIRSWPVTVEVRQACRAIGISPSWGYQLIASGAFPCRVIKVGHRMRVITASLLALLEAT
jgi:predicted DNA-binding transcriptional regulator AlpA